MGGVYLDINICNIEDVIAKGEDFIVIISSQYGKDILDSLNKYHLEFFKDLYMKVL